MLTSVDQNSPSLEAWEDSVTVGVEEHLQPHSAPGGNHGPWGRPVAVPETTQVRQEVLDPSSLFLLFKCELSELFCSDNFLNRPSQTEIITKFSSNDIEDVSHLPSRRFDWSALILNISIQSSLHWARLIQRKNLSQLFKPDSTVRDSPVSFPIPQTAVGTDTVSPNFKMIKHNLNLK